MSISLNLKDSFEDCLNATVWWSEKGCSWDSYAFLVSNIRSAARPLAIFLPSLLSFILPSNAPPFCSLLLTLVQIRFFVFVAAVGDGQETWASWCRVQHNEMYHGQIHDIGLILDVFEIEISCLNVY